MLGEPVAVVAVLFVVGHLFREAIEVHLHDGEVGVEERLPLVVVHPDGVHAALDEFCVTETGLVQKVGDLPLAVKYFNEYLKKYPFSAQAVVAQRFLNEIKAKGKQK